MRASSVLAIAIVLSAGLVTSTLAHEGLPSQYNYRDDVRPIFVKHCAGCHRPGGAGPMSLLTYSEAVPWANSVKMQVLDDQMPPWLPEEGIGAFEHTRSLSADEIDILIDWVIGQTPEGEPMSAEETAVEPPPEWVMGQPDLVLAPKTDTVIGAEDYELTACTVLPTETTVDHIAAEFELKPGLATIVRRATIYLGTSCDKTPPVATWLPGQEPGLSRSQGPKIPAGATLAVEIAYAKGWEDEGKRLTDRSELGIRFADSGRAVSSMRIADGIHRFSDGVEIVAVLAEVGEQPRDEPLVLEAVRPDGDSEPILVIEDFRPEWSEKYVLAEPLVLPAGSQLRLSQSAVWIDFIGSTAAGDE